MGNIIKVGCIPDCLQGMNGYLVEYIEKPRSFFNSFDETNVKKEWFTAPALSWTLRECACIRVLKAQYMNTKEYSQLHEKVIVNYWSGAMERMV